VETSLNSISDLNAAHASLCRLLLFLVVQRGKYVRNIKVKVVAISSVGDKLAL